MEEIAFQARAEPEGRPPVGRQPAVADLPVWKTSSPTPSAGRSMAGEDQVVARVTDIYAALPSITGKFELEYEGELQGRRQRGP